MGLLTWDILKEKVELLTCGTWSISIKGHAWYRREVIPWDSYVLIQDVYFW